MMKNRSRCDNACSSHRYGVATVCRSPTRAASSAADFSLCSARNSELSASKSGTIQRVRLPASWRAHGRAPPRWFHSGYGTPVANPPVVQLIHNGGALHNVWIRISAFAAQAQAQARLSRTSPFTNRQKNSCAPSRQGQSVCLALIPFMKPHSQL